MLSIIRTIVLGLSLAILFLILPPVTPACAYIDPNTGNLIFQILLPIITAITTALLFFKNKVRRLYCRIKESLTSVRKKSKSS